MTTPKEKIAKLEGLLGRVKERADAPRTRTTQRTGSSARSPIAAASVAAAPVAAAPVAAAPIAAAPVVSDEAPSAAPDTSPPATLANSSPLHMPHAATAPDDPEVEASVDTDAEDSLDANSDMEVEVSSEVVEIDIDENGMMMPAESGAHAVAHAVAADAELEEVSTADELLAVDARSVDAETYAAESDVTDVADSERDVEPERGAAVAAEPEPPPGNEVLEPAPSSSPRPIAADASPSYAEESGHRHTPPPESGKQVAAPSVKPEPRKSSAPPSPVPALHGGWREPGIAAPREGGPEPRVPSARPPAPPPAAISSGVVRSAPPPPPPPPPFGLHPSAASRSITPEVTKADWPGEVRVAAIEGSAPPVAMATFGDVLDATLAL